MPSYKVKVKWGRETFPNIEVNTDEEPLLFKAQLYALTGVQPDRQKIMCKGQALKDSEWNIQMKDGAIILLLGTKEDVPTEPIERPKFVEDMNEAELATAMDLPPGMTNLGNTCYMNATVQCLKAVPELRDLIKNFKENHSVSATSGVAGAVGGGTTATTIVNGMRAVFNQMDSTGSSTVNPMGLLLSLHIAFPQFAQTGENGIYRQQDANECWSELLKMLQQTLPPVAKSIEGGGGGGSSASPAGDVASYKSFIDQYFGGTFDVEMKCAESSDEKPTLSKENFLQLSCFISQEVKYMQSGLRSKMQEQLTKMSQTLERNAVYTKSSLISRLPAYLTVNFVRFQYKGKEGINAKILKDIKFPIDFDAFELCTPALQEKLVPMRNKFKEAEDAALEKQTKLKESHKSEKENNSETISHPYHFENDLGSNNSGFYTLQAVLTHQGRSSSSGHYVGWVRYKGDKWMKFDDDVVTPVESEDILRLSGGGDWHCAYVLLYGPKILETAVQTEAATTATVASGGDAAKVATDKMEE